MKLFWKFYLEVCILNCFILNSYLKIGLNNVNIKSRCKTVDRFNGEIDDNI